MKSFCSSTCYKKTQDVIPMLIFNSGKGKEMASAPQMRWDRVWDDILLFQRLLQENPGCHPTKILPCTSVHSALLLVLLTCLVLTAK
jgi:hypothetical protein